MVTSEGLYTAEVTSGPTIQARVFSMIRLTASVGPLVVPVR